MIDIACDACGKRYRIDEAKMKAETAKVKCKTCGHVISVTRPQPAGTPLPAPGNESALRDLRRRSPTG
jgi:predicted Zn finger-like uncharacterized protein